jgi:STE24 endopeptidase
MSSGFVTSVFVAALLGSLALRLWLASRQVRHVVAHRVAVPPFFAGTIGLAAHQKGADYTVARTRFEMLALAFGAAVLLGWTLFGGLDALNVAVRDWVQPRFGDLAYGVALMVAFSVIGSLIELPLDAWRTFRIEQQFGFNRLTLRLWLVDLLKGTLVSAVVAIPIVALVLWLMTAAGAWWWLWAFAALVGFALLMQVIYPLVIAPIFNKFQPLADESLKRRVEALMARCGFRAKGFYVMDGSRRSAHANAYFTGFGAGKRVVFFDTLLSKLSAAEVEAVLAHELGHFRHRHVLKRMLTMFTVWLAVFALLGWLLTQTAFYTGLGVAPNLAAPNSALALILLLSVGPVFTVFLTPAFAATSRRHEFEADAYACAQASGNDLAAALLKLYEDNASTLTPDPLYVRFHYSHPPAGERLAAMKALA